MTGKDLPLIGLAAGAVIPAVHESFSQPMVLAGLDPIIVFIISMAAISLSIFALVRPSGILEFILGPEGPRLPAVPVPEDLPGAGWDLVGEEDWFITDLTGRTISEEDLSTWGFEGGSTVLYERDGDRAAFTVLRFLSFGGARQAFERISSEVEEAELYSTSVGSESVGVYGEAFGADQVFFRKENVLALATITGRGGAEKGDSIAYAHLLEDKIG